MINYKEHLIVKSSPVSKALEKLNKIAPDSILFIIDENEQLIGSITDGDIRRGLLKGLAVSDKLTDFMQNKPHFIVKGEDTFDKVINLREQSINIIPVLNQNGQVLKVINFRQLKSYLPVDAVIMAGGRGSRLSPLTDTVPKPLLKIGDKPILEYNTDRLRKFGIDDFWISLRYLGEQIENYFKDGSSRAIDVRYIWEDEALGTVGAVSKIEDLKHDTVLITNSDVLTDLDYEKLYQHFIKEDADMSVVTIPYTVNIPYAVLEMIEGKVKSFKEKPSITYYSNGGIYMVKRKVLDLIPKDKFFNATDLMEVMIAKGMKVTSYSLIGYWLDIGKPDDFQKAQEDVKFLKL